MTRLGRFLAMTNLEAKTLALAELQRAVRLRLGARKRRALASSFSFLVSFLGLFDFVFLERFYHFDFAHAYVSGKQVAFEAVGFDAE